MLNGATSTVVVKVKVKADAVSNAGHPFGMTNSAEIASIKVRSQPGEQQGVGVHDRRGLGGPAGDEALQARRRMRAGNIATCTIFVDNLGSSDARNVTLTDTHVSDGSFTIVSALASPGGACPVPSGVVTCDLGTEPAGGRTTIVVKVTATEAEDINDCAKPRASRRIRITRTTSRATASASSPLPT